MPALPGLFIQCIQFTQCMAPEHTQLTLDTECGKKIQNLCYFEQSVGKFVGSPLYFGTAILLVSILFVHMWSLSTSNRIDFWIQCFSGTLYTDGEKLNIAVTHTANVLIFKYPYLVTRSLFKELPNTSQRTLCLLCTTQPLINCPGSQLSYFHRQQQPLYTHILLYVGWGQHLRTAGIEIRRITVGELSEHAMWTTERSFIVLAVTLCSAAGGVTGAGATNPGLQSAFTSKGLAYSELGGAVKHTPLCSASCCSTIHSLYSICTHHML